MRTPDLAARGRAYTLLCTELRRQGPLWPAERALILGAADALLFDEPDAPAAQQAALELLRTLEANDRRTDAEALRLSEALLGCAAPIETMALCPTVRVAAAAPVREQGATHAS
jgi:hypothetical protein